MNNIVKNSNSNTCKTQFSLQLVLVVFHHFSTCPSFHFSPHLCISPPPHESPQFSPWDEPLFLSDVHLDVHFCPEPSGLNSSPHCSVHSSWLFFPKINKTEQSASICTTETTAAYLSFFTFFFRKLLIVSFLIPCF